ncbi:hypothetical protein [Mesorhizobium captivum]|uniref:hypothetical protein n=1 Tax=Mesorhizobium captivum TaxID=3072319 RepID=UPI002A23B725|nr:hypothetical protein [Mesorhizobium sp. VK23E]MDX8516355.1 hypothetical protein [Mesorhizobium sp. VK23E]
MKDDSGLFTDPRPTDDYMVSHVIYIPPPALDNIQFTLIAKYNSLRSRIGELKTSLIQSDQRIMAKQDGPSDRQRAIQAAVRRFPQFELAIHRLIVRSESFLEICEELAEAELALSSVDKTTTALVEARRAEWQELVDRLVGEVGAAVQNSEAIRNLGVNPRPPR